MRYSVFNVDLQTSAGPSPLDRYNYIEVPVVYDLTKLQNSILLHRTIVFFFFEVCFMQHI